MPPKGAKPAKGKSKTQEDQREESLQAVVLADSFETRFRPFTCERPRCLLPLANTPLIEYTLEFLANAGVQDIYIYCGALSDQVEEYIGQSKWKLPSSPFHTLTILKSTATSVGDAMRDLDNRDLITGDFILVSGDVISNVNLEPVLSKHRARRQKTKDAIMTLVLREAGTVHRAKSKGRRPLFVIDPRADRCLHYEEMGRRKGERRYVTLDSEFLSSFEEIEVREDLIDCHIDICTPDVLAQWTENFDYQTLRKNFLFGVLKDFELNGKTVHTHVIEDQYAARAQSLRAYDAVSRDVMGRWTYPFCPDSNLVPGQSYQFGYDKCYQEDGVILARSAIVKDKSVLGAGTSIREGSIVSGSVLGRRCKIGKNVRIEDAYIWDGVTVGDNSNIQQTVIANNAIVGIDCSLEPGSLISYGVKIPNNTTIQGTTHTVSQDTTASENEDSDASSTASSHLLYRNPSATTSISSISTLSPSDASGQDSAHISRRDSDLSNPSSTSEAVANRDFHHEASASILDGLQKGDAAETILLELNGYRMSVDASQHEVRHAVVSAFVKRIISLTSDERMGLREAVKQVFANYRALLERIVLDDASSARKADQVDFLLLVQKEVVGRDGGDQLLLFVAKQVYDDDVVVEEGVLQWWGDERSSEGKMGDVRGLTAQFIQFLEEADEDDDEDDDEESEEEESE